MEPYEDTIARKRRQNNERQKRWLAKQSEEALAKLKAANTAYQQRRRARLTPEQENARRAANAASQRRFRERLTPQQTADLRAANAKTKQRSRERLGLTHEQAEENRLEKDTTSDRLTVEQFRIANAAYQQRYRECLIREQAVARRAANIAGQTSEKPQSEVIWEEAVSFIEAQNYTFEDIYKKNKLEEAMTDEANEDVPVSNQEEIDGNLKCSNDTRLHNDIKVNNSCLSINEVKTEIVYIKEEYVEEEELNKDINSFNSGDDLCNKSETNIDNIIIKQENIKTESTDTELCTTLVENIKEEPL